MSKIEEIAERLDFENGEVKFFVPQTEEEIRNEGHRMDNALQVPIWDEEHFAGEKVLVFMYKGDGCEPENCVDMLIDMRSRQVIHYVSIHNGDVSNDSLNEIKRWAEERDLTVLEKSMIM